MRFSPVHWVAALGSSILLHALATTVLSQQEPSAEIERGVGDPVMIASDLAARVSTVSSDDVAEVIEPVTEAEQSEEPVHETLEPEPVMSKTPEPVHEPIQKPVEQEAVVPPQSVKPVENVPDKTVQPVLNVETADTVTPDLVAPPDVEKIHESADPASMAAVQPEEVSPEEARLLDVPLPQPKPARPLKAKAVEPVKEKKPVRKTQKPQRRSKPTQKRQTSGSNKQAQPNRKPGDAGRNKKATGKANISNYMGRVASRLQRQKRYPKAAKRKKIQGTVVVSFIIRRNGSVAGVRIARRSGHGMLDQEVLAMVRRASPFPPIPANAGRSTITVTVPISFRAR